MGSKLLLVQVVLGLALLSGCTATPVGALNTQSDLSSSAANESWPPSDLLTQAGFAAGSDCVQASDSTALDSHDVIALLGKEGDMTQAPPRGATVSTVKARVVGGCYDGRIVWIVGVYPVEMPLLRGGPGMVLPVDEDRTGRHIAVFDANTGESLQAMYAGGPPVGR